MLSDNHIAMKRCILFYIYLIGFVLLSFAQSNVIDQVVWVVGDEAIFYSDVENTRIDAIRSGMTFDGDPYCIIPEELAINKLFLNQAALDSITVTDVEIQQEVDYMISLYEEDLGGMENVERAMQMPEKDIRSRLADQARNQILISGARKNIVEHVNVTPAEVRKYVKAMPLDSIPFVPTKVEVQIITQEPKVLQTEIDKIKSDLRNYTERVQSGRAQFSTLALLYSEDPGTARQGGETGFFGRGEMVPEFSQVAFSLTDPGKVSKIVETEYGFHIIQLIEKRGEKINVRHILRKPQVDDADIDSCMLRLDSIADEIRRGGFTFEEGAQYCSYDKETRNNKGLMSYRPAANMPAESKFEMQQLPYEIARQIQNMRVGEISDAFTMTKQNGKVVCAIVKLKNRIDGHKANVTEDYQILKEGVLAIKQEEAIMKWIKEQQKTVYVHISPGWNDCEFKYPGWRIR